MHSKKDKKKHLNIHYSMLINILGTFLLTMSVSITTVLIPAVMESYSFRANQMGAIFSMETIGSFLVCFLFPLTMRKMSVITGMLLITAIRIPALLYLASTNTVEAWLIGMLFNAISCYWYLLVTQTWMNTLPIKKNVGTWMAVYSTTASIAMAAGPVLSWALERYFSTLPHHLIQQINDLFSQVGHLLPVDQSSATLPIEFKLKFALATVIGTLALIPILLAGKHIPNLKSDKRLTIFTTIKNYKGPMFAIALGGLTYFALSSFLVIYGIQNGLSPSQAGLLFTAFTLGSIFLEIPLGWISDNVDSRFLLVGCTFLSAVCAAFFPLYIDERISSFILVFLWGGVVGAIYSISLSLLSKKYKDDALISANVGYSVMEGTGGTVGLVLIGFSMEHFGQDGLPYVILLACVAYFIFALTRYKVV